MSDGLYLPDDCGVMVRAGRDDDFQYSDGDAVEEEIGRIVGSARDLSSGSEQLAGQAHSWSMEYHLSPSRGNVLRPLSWRDTRVLEVGAGCGALTRFLGEQGADVVAVEGSLRRARIARARCVDLPNVRVYCDTLQGFVCDVRFDVVVAVGVLEYAPVYVGGRDPVVAFLEQARGYLKPAGVLLIAIENQLGLKYFAGVAEDHTGELFFGVQDRYQEQRRYVTFGRGELTAKLQAAGFSSVEYLYPFPDYKLPTLMFTHEALTAPDLPVAEMISRAPTRDGGWPRVHLFCEAAAWEAVCRNGLAPDLSNSFLAAASDKPRLAHLLPDGWLAAKYHTGRRRGFRTVTTFVDSRGGIRVERRLLHGDGSGGSSDLVRLRVPSDAAFVVGGSLNRSLVRALSNPAVTSFELCALLAPWAVFLQRAVEEGAISIGDARLPGGYLDCVPWNLHEQPDGRDFVYAGTEWDYLPPLNVGLPFLHGMINLALFVDACSVAEVLRTVPYGDFLMAAAERLGIVLNRRELAAALEAEADWVSDVLPVDREQWLERITSLMEAPLASPPTLPQVLGRYQARLARLGVSAEAASGAPQSDDDLELLAGLPRVITRSDRPVADLET